MITATDVSFAYREADAVHDVNLSSVPDQVLGLIGPNGSGKTTLLRLLSGALSPRRGSVRIDGRDISDLSTAQLIAVVDQDAEIPLGLTAAELVLLGRTPHLSGFQSYRKIDRDIAVWALERVRALDLARQPLNELSGGERKRVLIARALAQETPYIFLDEPTNHLDIRYQHEVLQLVHELDKTVVVVLHDLNLAARYCDRLALLERGHVVAQGWPDDVLREETVSTVYQVGTERVDTRSGLNLHFSLPYLP